MDYKNIKIIQRNKGAYLIINREEFRNALNKETMDEMKDYMESVKNDSNVGVIIITGEGEKSFAAGADIGELKERQMLQVLETGGMKEFYNYIEKYEKPTVAMINGFALGGGLELAMVCDLRIASDNAKLGLPELNLGVIPGAGGTQRLSRLIGKAKAVELIMTGKVISSAEAKAIGLVSELVSLDDLFDRTEELVETILSKGPLALRLAKLSINYGTESNLETGLIIEKLAQTILFGTEDKMEGTSAFLEKRTPEYKGK